MNWIGLSIGYLGEAEDLFFTHKEDASVEDLEAIIEAAEGIYNRAVYMKDKLDEQGEDFT